MNKLKIAFITNNYTPYSGGVVSSIKAFKKGLENLGHEIYIITLDFHGKPEKEDGVLRLYCPIKFSYKKNPMAVPWQTKKQLEKILKGLKPDIIHSHHPFLLGKAALKIAIKHSIPIVFTYHTQYERYLHYLPFPELLTKPLAKKLVKDYCKKVDHIITPTETIKTQLSAKNTLPPITTIPSPLDPIFFEKFGSKKQKKAKFELLTISRFTKEKNLYFLLDAVAQLPQRQFQFTLVGYGPEEENLREYAFKTLNLSNVTFVIKPQKETLRSLYAQADLFIFSSTTETQGLVLAESMASGTPVIAVKAAGSQDIIDNGTNGFLIKSKDEMLKKIIELSSDLSLLNSLSYNAGKTALEYRQEKLCHSLIDSIYLPLKSKNLKVS